MTRISLNPLFSHSIGFDRFNELFDSILSDGQANKDIYPPYNIEKWGDDEYCIVASVAGLQEKDLDVTVQGNTLKIRASRATAAPVDDKVTYLYQGIPDIAFERTFSLADHVRVTEARLNNGLLRVRLVRELPEAQKPRMIPINAQAAIENKTSDKDVN